MRRLALLCLAVAAASAYNLVIQEFTLTGGLITSNQINCDNIDTTMHIGKNAYNIDCFDQMSPDDAKKIESRKIIFMGPQITTKASSIDGEIMLKKGTESVKFSFKPQTSKVGQVQTASGDGTYKAPEVATTPTAATTTASTPVQLDCDDKDKAKPECVCQKPVPATGTDPACSDEWCKDKDLAAYPGCTKPAKKEEAAKLPSKATRVKLPMPLPAQPSLSIASDLPPAVRLRGPGPARPPVHRFPVPEDTVVEDSDEEVRRVKREDPPKVDDNTVKVAVSYYVLDEPGNPAAVWAAVIEGIILLVLVGACVYFFCWAPRARAVASASADPYKPEGNYSVSYANNSYGQNQRIDAFQNPPPAAPPRPANSGYMDDYITDNIGAMSRPGATTTAPAAAPAASAIPASSNFQPGHQRFDSSGLVTVNLS